MSQPSHLEFTTKNHILSSLPRDDLERVLPHLHAVECGQGEILFDRKDPIPYVYFPDVSMISVVVSTISGETAEAGVIGCEGVGGVEAVMGTPTSLNRHLIRLGGRAHRAEWHHIHDEFVRGGELQRLILGFLRVFMLQMSQTTLCNRLHVAEKRLAKWLLMCRDRTPGDMLHVTQEFAAHMLGANRASVTQSAKTLRDRGLITYSRGLIRILDNTRLEEFSCECYAPIREEYERFIL